MTQPDPSAESVGSVAEEAFKLFRAMTTPPGSEAGADHVCSTAWCPVCQVVGLVRDHPGAVAKVSDSAAQLGRSLKELLDVALTPKDES